MLIRNNTVIRPSKGAEEGSIDKEVYDALVEIKKKPTYVFKTRKSRQTLIDSNGRERRDMKRGLTIPLVSYSDGEFGADEWWYVKNPRSVKVEDGAYVEKTTGYKKNKTMYETMVLQSNTDADLIYYLLNCSLTVRSGKVFEYDMQSIAKQENEDNKNFALAMSLIFQDDSPLSNDSKLKQMASAWGVTGVETLDNAQIKSKLWSNVQSTHASTKGKRGYAAFIEECNDETEVEARSMSGALIQRELIQYNKKYHIYEIKAKGGYTQRLCNLPPETNSDSAKFEYLVNFLKGDKYMLGIVREVYENNGYERQPIVVKNVENGDDKVAYLKELEKQQGIDAVKDLAKKHDVKYVFRKKEDMLAELATKI